MLDNRPGLKKFIIFLISPKRNPRPRMWVKLFVNRFFHKIGKGAVVRRRHSRIDVFPWHRFEVGRYSLIEDFSVINNGAGDVIIGDESRVGIGSVIIGPVRLGNKVGIGQNVFISGFNHGYENGEIDSNEQELVIKEVIIDEESHIGSNSVILPGIKIGKRVQVGAGSVVTKDIDSFCVVVGNPAIVIKRYDFNEHKWIKCE